MGEFLKLQRQARTDGELLMDRVYAAMETGNAAEARRVLAEHSETMFTEVRAIRASVLRDYGISL